MAKQTAKPRGPKAGQVLSCNLTVRIPFVLMSQLEARCAQDGVSRATVIKTLLDRHLDRKEGR
jgi:hypothetical protein